MHETMMKLRYCKKGMIGIYKPHPSIYVVSHIQNEFDNIICLMGHGIYNIITISHIFINNNMDYMNISIMQSELDERYYYYGQYKFQNGLYIPYGTWRSSEPNIHNDSIVFINGKISGNISGNLVCYDIFITDEYIILNSKHLYNTNKKYVHNIHINDDSKSFISVKNALGEIKITVDNNYIYFTRNGNLYKKEFNSDKIVLGINGETKNLINALLHDISL